MQALVNVAQPPLVVFQQPLNVPVVRVNVEVLQHVQLVQLYLPAYTALAKLPTLVFFFKYSIQHARYYISFYICFRRS